MISPNTIQQITSRIDIIDVVGEFVKLKKRGTNYLGVCPFHNEKTPSFTVSPSKEIYKCFVAFLYILLKSRLNEYVSEDKYLEFLKKWDKRGIMLAFLEKEKIKISDLIYT